MVRGKSLYGAWGAKIEIKRIRDKRRAKRLENGVFPLTKRKDLVDSRKHNAIAVLVVNILLY